MAGALRQVFGVCTNAWSPSDGAVVSLDHGCGAHSEVELDLPSSEPELGHVLDEFALEVSAPAPLRGVEPTDELTESDALDDDDEQSRPDVCSAGLRRPGGTRVGRA